MEQEKQQQLIEERFNAFMSNLLEQLKIVPNEELAYNIGLDYDTSKILNDLKDLVNKIQNTDEGSYQNEKE